MTSSIRRNGLAADPSAEGPRAVAGAAPDRPRLLGTAWAPARGSQDNPSGGPPPDGGNNPGDPGPNGEARAHIAPLTVHAGRPIVAWAVRDRYPIRTDTFTCAVAAIDEWAGIESVTFSFFESDGATPLTVSPVGGDPGDTFTVQLPVWADVFGHGRYADYWLVELDVSEWTWSDDRDDVVVQVSVRTVDGVEHDQSGGLGPRVLRKAPDAPRIVYLDAVNGDDQTGVAGDPSRPFRTINEAVEIAQTTADFVYAQPGRYPTTQSLRTWPGVREKFLVVQRDPAGESGEVVIATDARRVIYEWIAFDGVVFEADTDWETEGPYQSFESCEFRYDQSGTGTFTADGHSHHSFINCLFLRGNRGLLVVQKDGVVSAHNLVHDCEFTRLGTTIRVQTSYTLLERIESHGNAQGAEWPPEQHFEFSQLSGDELRQNVIYRYCRVYDCGNAASGHNYSFGVHSGLLRNIAYYNISYHCAQGSQQVLGFSSGAPGDPTTLENIQIAHVTFVSDDTPVDTNRGLIFSRTGDDDVRYPGYIMVRNSLIHRLTQVSSGAGGSSLTNAIGPVLNEGLAVANGTSSWQYPPGTMVIEGDPSVNGYRVTRDETGCVRPDALSFLVSAGRPSDVRFDFSGSPRALVPSIGAAEPPADGN